MAVTFSSGFGPCANDPAVYDLTAFGGNPTLERTGITAGNPGWMKYAGVAVTIFTIDDSEVAGPTDGSYFVWDIFYFYGRAVPSGTGTPNSTYKGVWKCDVRYLGTHVPINASTALIELRMINAGGTHKFQLVETDVEEGNTITVLATSGEYISETIRTIVIRWDYANKKIAVFIDGTDMTSGGATLILTGLSSGTPQYFTVITGAVRYKWMETAVSSHAIDGYWSSWGRLFSSTSSDLDPTTQYPEVHGHAPGGNGTYNDWRKDDLALGTASYTEWDDLASNGTNDGETTWNRIGQEVGRQTSIITYQTYTNTIKGAMQFVICEETGGSKSIPWTMLTRYLTTDKESAAMATLPTSFTTVIYTWANMPTGAWSNINSLEVGARRTANGDLTNLKVTAIWLEGMALGTTIKAPAAPPPRLPKPILVKQAVNRAGTY